MKPIFPMEPKSGSEIPNGDGWLHQIKWDGVRVLTYWDGNDVRLFNRKLYERTLHYPEITEISTYCKAQSIILDGEVIALGADGKPSFHEVMRRDGLRRMERVGQIRREVPVSYMIFDIVYADGEWVHQKPLIERLSLLNERIKSTERIQTVASHQDGAALFNVMKQHGMEGIVAKQKDSAYAIGEKKDTWLKIKNYRDLIAVIGGFTLDGAIVNAVLLGLYDANGKLWYIGHTGTGKMTKQEWRNLTDKLRPTAIRERPFTNVPERNRDAHWVRPTVAVKIKYAEWTEGRALRQPSIQAFVDVPPEQCVFSPEMMR